MTEINVFATPSDWTHFYSLKAKDPAALETILKSLSSHTQLNSSFLPFRLVLVIEHHIFIEHNTWVECFISMIIMEATGTSIQFSGFPK